MAQHIELLRRMGWTQDEMARAAGVSQGTISRASARGIIINLTTADAILAVKPGQSRR